MRTRDFSTAIMMLTLVSLLMAAIPPGATVKGVREEDLAIYYYASQEAAFNALATGEIDLIMGGGYSPSLFPAGNLDAIGFLPPDQAWNAFENPNIVVDDVRAFNMYEFDLNNNYSIAAYPGIRSPMNYIEMRQAIAFLSDKDYYVETLRGGLAERIDQPLPARLSNWGNPNWMYPNYPYEYDPAAAKNMLDSTFLVGTTPNPYYDPFDPLSSATLREYPADHPTNAGEDLDPLKFYVRVDHNARLQSGRAIYQALRKMGVPIDVTECPSSVSHAPVMGEHNYHFYTGAWTTWRFPTHVYPLYHSDFTYSYGPNHVTGPGTHPLLDNFLAAFYYAPTFGTSVAACSVAMAQFTADCVTVPLWSDHSYCAWSNDLFGVVNMDGYGIINPYTFMNAYKIDGTPIRCGTVNDPISMNTVYASSVHDYNNLDRMNLYNNIEIPPYNIAADQACFVANFETTTWVDPDDGQTKTKVIQSFREDAYTAKPVSGDQGENINADTYFWNAWLDYQIGDGWFGPSFKDLHHVVITGTHDFEIYFNTLGYWNTYAASGPLRPRQTWMAQGSAFIAETTETVIAPAMPGAIPLTYDPIWFTSVAAGGTPLTFMTDYNIVRGQLYILTPHTGNVVVTYYYVPTHQALRGFFPGGLPWQTILEGAGQYYITSYSTSASTFRRNPFYYMVTPYLGEVDFTRCERRRKERRPPCICGYPAVGNYKVDSFDLALGAGAFGSQGTAIPSSNWIPGVDLAPSGGQIDIFDTVTITGVNWDKCYDPHECQTPPAP